MRGYYATPRLETNAVNLVMQFLPFVSTNITCPRAVRFEKAGVVACTPRSCAETAELVVIEFDTLLGCFTMDGLLDMDEASASSGIRPWLVCTLL